MPANSLRRRRGVELLRLLRLLVLRGVCARGGTELLRANGFCARRSAIKSLSIILCTRSRSSLLLMRIVEPPGGGV